jgi:hypothetical protein
MSLIMLGKEHKLCSFSLCSFLQSPVTSSLFGRHILIIQPSNTLSVLVYVQPAIRTKNINTTSLEHFRSPNLLSRRNNLLNFWRSEGICKHPILLAENVTTTEFFPTEA